MGEANLTQNNNSEVFRVAIIISPNFGDYAIQHLKECLKSVESQMIAGEAGIFLVDNASSEESYAYLKRCAPHANIIRCEDNKGFAGGNNLAMRAAMDGGYEYLLLINMDTIMAPDCIHNLLSLTKQTPSGAAFQARLMMWPDQERVNSSGNQTHFLGFGFCGECGEEYKKDMSPRMIAHPSGAAVLFRSAALRAVGLFDESFWMYCEDLDLGWRLWLAGFECWYAPEAVVYHKYSFFAGPEKFYWLDRNRIISIVKNYHFASLLIILPAFLLMEFGTFVHAAANGWLRQKILVWGWFLNPGHWGRLFRSRKMAQALRRRADREIVWLFRGKVDSLSVDSIAMRSVNVVLSLYWFLARKLIFW